MYTGEYADELTIIPDPKREDASDFIMTGSHAWLTIGDTSVFLGISDDGKRLEVKSWPHYSEAEDPTDETSIALIGAQ